MITAITCLTPPVPDPGFRPGGFVVPVQLQGCHLAPQGAVAGCVPVLAGLPRLPVRVLLPAVHILLQKINVRQETVGICRKIATIGPLQPGCRLPPSGNTKKI